MLTVTKDQAAAFLVNYHRFHSSALPPLVGPEDIFRHLRLLQYDPLNPCGRNLDLVLQSRLKNYHPNDYLPWAYDQARAIEGYDKELCLLPIEDWGYLHYYQDRMSTARKQFIMGHRQELDDLLRHMADHGPLLSDAIKDDHRTVDIGWYGPTGWGKTALESLWRLGEVVAVRQPNGRKLYDLPERVYGHTMPARPSLSDHITRRLGSVGLLPLSGGGTGWQGVATGRTVGPQLKKMVQNGSLSEVVVGGHRTKYVVRAQDVQLLESPPQTKKVMTLLAPLDNLLWDRQLVHDLFGFFYRWEVYTPQHKRTHGYYCLPILDGHRMIGRIEPVLRDGNLVVKGLWWEPGVRPNHSRLDQALRDFQRYLKADSIILRTSGD